MTNFSFSQNFANTLAKVGQTPFQELKPPGRTGESIKNSQSQSFEPQYHQIKKLGLKINKSKISAGTWSSYENQVYLHFMMENARDFQTQNSRRKNKVFYRLSKVLKRRTPDQCRSHHQKLQLKYKDNFKAIVSEVRKKIQKSMAVEYVNQHQKDFHFDFPINELGQNPNIKQQRENDQIQDDWYDIRIKGSGWIVQIDSSRVKAW